MKRNSIIAKHFDLDKMQAKNVKRMKTRNLIGWILVGISVIGLLIKFFHFDNGSLDQLDEVDYYDIGGLIMFGFGVWLLDYEIQDI